jgi:hypothetical protein
MNSIKVCIFGLKFFHGLSDLCHPSTVRMEGQRQFHHKPLAVAVPYPENKQKKLLSWEMKKVTKSKE